MADDTLDLTDDIAAAALVELERGAGSGDEARLQILEELYRSLEGHLDASGSDALR
ncbi:MAG: hypothetical protein M3N53_06950 [Actinomycetota bacterium]|nr:hypothetical protein [Actinomycetota bacterium]